jgi:uncharacterized peroxidase-related enzyme
MSEQTSWLGAPPASAATEAAYDADRDSDGYVWNVTRLWAWRPDLYEAFAALRTKLMSDSALTDRDWAVLVTSTAAQLGDSYCVLAWGAKLARLSDGETAAQVVAGASAPGLSEREAALSAWARQLVRDPNATTEGDVGRLRAVGLGEREILEATAFIAFRLAFSTVNDALGAAPDKQLADAAPAPVRAALSFGRAPAAEPSLP